jgi:succinylarginine dihydrolase
MLLVAPTTCQAIPKVAAFLQDLIANPNNPIQEVCFVNLTQSMHNGGGPACLRLRVVLNKQEYRAMHQEVLVNERLLDTLEDWVCRHYRTGLEVTDLSDMALMHESHKALDELTTLLDLGPIYPFQKKFLETKST